MTSASAAARRSSGRRRIGLRDAGHTMWKQSRVVVVVPAWEEAPRIARVVRGLPAWVDAILVVDDASRDGTGDAARAVGDARVEVLRHATNRGVGAAIASGYRRALAMPGGGPRDAFVVMAGDGQMDPSDLPELVDPVARGDADYVKGDRFHARGREPRRTRAAFELAAVRAMPPARLLGGVAFSWATSRAIG